MAGINYYCSGSLLVCVLYGICTQEWLKRNKPEEEGDKNVRKAILRKWNNEFDWFTVMFCAALAVG